MVPRVVEDARFARARLSYDLWLIDVAPGKPTLTRHVLLTGRQGERVDVELPPLSWPLDGVRIAGSDESLVLTRVTGSILGRVRDGGVVDIALDAARRLSVAKDLDDRMAEAWDGGRKVLRISAGETLALVLPPAQGEAWRTLDGKEASVVGAPGMTPPAADTLLATPVELTPESVTVNFGRFFEGHSLSLRLTARREDR